MMAKEVSEKPIIFNIDMVRATITCACCGKISVPFPCEFCGSEDFLKAVTRRIINPQPRIAERKENDPQRESYLWKVEKSGRWKGKVIGGTHTREEFTRYAPYQVGDHLWVKETYCHGDEWDDEKPKDIDPLCGGNDVWYFADGPRPSGGWGKTRSARFMPKWAARIWLEVLDVRPEELQKITFEECLKEGLSAEPDQMLPTWIQLWDSLNAKRGYPWELNPWVWRYEFKRINK
jgi:hypothetical protein